jgi:ribosomal protein S27E
MPYRDPSCVFVAENFGHADVVAGWLGAQGVSAEVMNRQTMGGLVSPLLTSSVGIEVWVLDPTQAREAIRLLGEHAVERFTNKPTGQPLKVVCEDCGKASIFPGNQSGTVQNCPHCNAFLDVEPADVFDQLHGSGGTDESEDGPPTDGITDMGPWGMTPPSV